MGMLSGPERIVIARGNARAMPALAPAIILLAREC
jgi:hypothetical protein